MSSRRAHPRFELPRPCQGTLRTVDEVTAIRNGGAEIVCQGNFRGTVGEEITLEVLGETGRAAVRAQIVESRPIPIDGSMRHELRLRVVGQPSSPEVELAGSAQTQ